MARHFFAAFFVTVVVVIAATTSFSSKVILGVDCGEDDSSTREPSPWRLIRLFKVRFGLSLPTVPSSSLPTA